MFFVAILLYSFLGSVAITTSVVLALWLVFGRTNLFLRMPIFLAALTLPGVFYALLEAGEGTFIVMFLACSILIGAMLSFRPWIVKVVMGVLLAFMIAIVFAQLPFLNWGRLEPILGTWIARLFFGTSLMAILFSVMRLLGFDIVRLLDGTNDLDLERRTGNSLDYWIDTLKDAKAETWNRARLASFLNEYGLGFSSQKDISMAFEKVLGRRTVGISLSGNAQTIANASEMNEKRSWFRRPAFEQLSIAQMLTLTFCAACLFRFTSLVYENLTTLTDYIIAVPLPIFVALVVLAMLVHFLSVGQGHRWMLVSVFSSFVLLCVLVHFVEQRFGSWGVAIGVFVFSIPIILALSAFLVQARYRGYRLVKVQQQPKAVVVCEPQPETVL